MHTIPIEAITVPITVNETAITVSITVNETTIATVSVTVSPEDVGLRPTEAVAVHDASPSHRRDSSHARGDDRAADGRRRSSDHDAQTGGQLAAVELQVGEELLVELVQLLGRAAVEVVPPVADEVQLAEERAVRAEERVADVVAAHVERLWQRWRTGQDAEVTAGLRDQGVRPGIIIIIIIIIIIMKFIEQR